MNQGDSIHVATNTNQLSHGAAAFTQPESSFPRQAHVAGIAASSTATTAGAAAQTRQRSNVPFSADSIQYSPTESPGANPRVHARPSVDSDHRAKRPRVQETSSPEETMNRRVCRQWYNTIERRVEQVTHAGLLNKNVEKPRYRILGEACQNEDFFYIAFHQALCAWTLNKEPVHVLFNGLVEPDLLDYAFEIMQTVVRRNDNMSSSQLQWFANFPTSIADFSRVFPNTSAAREISAFLIQMTTHWHTLIQSVQTRKYPLLAHELIHFLHCRARGLQSMLFTMSRRTLSVSDGPAAQAMNEIFERDRLDEITYEVRGEPPEALQSAREAVAMRHKQTVLSLQQEVPSSMIFHCTHYVSMIY
jgi:hypothetical protein